MDDLSSHPPKGQSQRIMIVSGEASGDLHGGALAASLFSKYPTLEIVGFGGDAMQSAGVDVRFDIKRLGIVGLTEVLYHFNSVIHAYRTALKLLREEVDLLVLIDFPDFNLRLAKTAKRLGITVVYYVSPQIWAWRSSRLQSIGERVDQMLVILPFEKEIYEKANIPCEFVGHPLLDEFSRLKIDVSGNRTQTKSPTMKTYLRRKGLDPDGTTIGLLPGSRKREVLALLPTMLEAIDRLARTHPKIQVLIPVASSLPEGLVEALIASFSLPIRTVAGNAHEVFGASDVAVVASGTATLQGALAGTPMIVVYKVSWITYWLGRCLLHVKSIGLANIVAERPFIPELIQWEANPTRIAQELDRLLKNTPVREAMRRGLRKVAERLGSAGASDRAASVICRLLEQRRKKICPPRPLQEVSL